MVCRSSDDISSDVSFGMQFSNVLDIQMFGHVHHPFFLLSWQTVQFVDRNGKGTAETEAAEVISAGMKRFRY